MTGRWWREGGRDSRQGKQGGGSCLWNGNEEKREKERKRGGKGRSEREKQVNGGESCLSDRKEGTRKGEGKEREEGNEREGRGSVRKDAAT